MADKPNHPEKRSLREIPTVGGAILTKVDASGAVTETHTGSTMSPIVIGSRVVLLDDDGKGGIKRNSTRPVVGITDNGDGSYTLMTGEPEKPEAQSRYVLTFLPQEAKRTRSPETGRIDLTRHTIDERLTD